MLSGKPGSADRNAIRQSLELLEKGETLGIFPQGGEHQDTAESSIQPRVGMLAMKSRAAVVPVAVIGTRGIPFGLDQAITGNNRQTP